MGHADETLLKKVAVLEAYVSDIQKSMDCVSDYKKNTIKLRSELDQVKKEMEEIWKMYKDYQGKMVLITNLETNHRSLKKKYMVLKKSLADYPDMRDTYKTVKRAVILWLIMSFLAMLGISVGMNLYFG